MTATGKESTGSATQYLPAWGIALALALMATITGCGARAAAPYPYTRDRLRVLPEAALVYKPSMTLRQFGYEHYHEIGSSDENPGTFGRFLGTSDSAQTVLAWYRSELLRRGWLESRNAEMLPFVNDGDALTMFRGHLRMYVGAFSEPGKQELEKHQSLKGATKYPTVIEEDLGWNTDGLTYDRSPAPAISP